MAEVAISVRHVSKEYVIAGINHDTLRDRIVYAWQSLLKGQTFGMVARHTFRACL